MSIFSVTFPHNNVLKVSSWSKCRKKRNLFTLCICLTALPWAEHFFFESVPPNFWAQARGPEVHVCFRIRPSPLKKTNKQRIETTAWGCFLIVCNSGSFSTRWSSSHSRRGPIPILARLIAPLWSLEPTRLIFAVRGGAQFVEEDVGVAAADLAGTHWAHPAPEHTQNTLYLIHRMPQEIAGDIENYLHISSMNCGHRHGSTNHKHWHPG